MKSTASCVIVGGGVVGLSIAYHLAARGLREIVLLEKEPLLGAGSTGRCAGGFRHQFSTESNIRLSQLSIGKLLDFPAELDQPLDIHQDGYLFLLDNPADVARFQAQVRLQRELGVDVEFLAASEIPRVLPQTELYCDDILAATYCGADGVSDPAGVTEGYRRGAVRLGARVETEQQVVAIETDAGRVAAVRTATGRRISTPIVVNAAGPHAAPVAALAGVELPVVPLRRFIWTTRPFPKAPPRWTLVIDFSSGFYFHRESGGVLFGMGNRDEPPTFELGMDPEFFDNVVAPVGTRRFPPLGDAELLAGWAGSYEASPDANPILGRVPGIEGFIAANGFSGHGFQHAPAVGQLIAEEILDGRAHTLDLAAFALARFAGGRPAPELGVV